MSETDLKTKKEDGALIPLLWQYGSGSLVVGVLMLVLYFTNHTDAASLGITKWTDAVLVTIHVVSLVTNNWLAVTALYYCDAFLSGLCRNTHLVFMAVSAWTIVWGIVPANRNVLAVFGMILILLASVFAAVSKYMRRRKAETQEKD